MPNVGIDKTTIFFPCIIFQPRRGAPKLAQDEVERGTSGTKPWVDMARHQNPNGVVLNANETNYSIRAAPLGLQNYFNSLPRVAQMLA